MLFNSYAFLFFFFPSTVGIYLLLRRFDVRLGILSLLGCSLFFYAWWDVRYLPLLLASIIGNYLIGRAISHCLAAGRDRAATALLSTGIAGNLVVLGVFKYLHFFAANLSALLGADLVLGQLILPLGISFFTFEQIAYLVDLKRGETTAADPLSYAFFVAFFPRLVAGPILRYAEIGPQLAAARNRAPVAEDLSIGITMFLIGLFKKVVLADNVAPFANTMFATAAAGQPVDLLVGWGGALAYTCQIYFDFSGYSDMAIGAARCCGFRFPVNFASPYKAADISDFWRRWHMTLSRFLRDYLYIALGGNRRGPARRYVNLMTTMLLGGLWHGANWTFVFWGALHGGYLVIHHAWRACCARRPALDRVPGWLGIAVTLFAVVIAWVFFRAPDFATALNVLRGMAGGHGLTIPTGLAFGPVGELLARLGIATGAGSGSALLLNWAWVVALLSIALSLPNTQQLLADWRPTLDAVRGKSGLLWSPTPRWAAFLALIGGLAVISSTRQSEFLYWQF